MRRLLLAIFLGAAIALVIGWLWFGNALRRTAPARPGGTAAPSAAGAAPAGDTRKIRATLFYADEGGARLVSADREVPYGDGTIEQARRLIETLVTPVDAPLVQVIPAGTTVRELFVTKTGEAFVDFSPEISKNHSGGSLDELLTVYAIVNTLTVNLPAITQVQILIEGKEVDTLAGHVDLRRPLAKNLTWSQQPGAQAPAPPVENR